MSAHDEGAMATDEELLDHLLRLMASDADLVEACVFCTEIQRRIDLLAPKVEGHG